MSIIDKRLSYKPFEYQEAYDYWKVQQQSHWVEWNIKMASSIQDWSQKLSDTDRKIISGVLLGFTQSEVVIGNYWAQKIGAWFPKPEIEMMANTFAAWESIHISSYNKLSDTLGLEEHDAFIKEPTAAAKLNNLIETPSETLREKARSIAVYSGFGEGVSLYSSFAILLHFATRNLMKGLADIIAYSVSDESIHSEAGCWLYRQLIKEFPELAADKSLEEELLHAARLTLQLEFDFIDKVFGDSRLPAGSHPADRGLGAAEVKAFEEHRMNLKLYDLGLPQIFTPNEELVGSVAGWFYPVTAGLANTDFFAARVTNYAKGNFNVDNINWDKVFLPFETNTEELAGSSRSI